MKAKTLLLSLFLTSTFFSFSQNYNMAIGIKSGYPGHGSINFKKYTGSNMAVDILAGTNFSGDSKYIWAECLFEYNQRFSGGSDANYYIGAGPSVGLYTAGSYTKHGKNFTGPWGGATGVVGLEYTFTAIPLNMAIEAGPYLNLMPQIYIDGMINIAVRFAFQ